MAVLTICSDCGTSNQPPNRFCTSCGSEFEHSEDAYTTEPLDPSVVFCAKNVPSSPVAMPPLSGQTEDWERNGLQRDQVDVVMQTLAEAVALWQWLWYYYGQHPAPEGGMGTSLPMLLAQLIENSRVRQEALHNLLVMELRSRR